MATQYGLTAQGFVTKQQQTIIEEINASLQQTFGANINLGAESVFGQIVGIFSEREALLWQLADAVYASQYPAGAEGTSVDNILALNNLKRLPASATATNPAALTQANGVTLYGLVLYGTPGTTVPIDSIINTTASPALSFILNSAVTIGSAINAVQSIFFGNVPTLGSFELAIQDPAGNTLTTSGMPYNSLANQTLLVFSGGTPAGASHFGLTLTQAGLALTTGNISTPGAFPTSAAIQSAITALTGYSGVTVAGSAGTYTISWGSIANPLTTVVNNTTTRTITPTNSVQASLNNLLDNSSVLLTGNTTNLGTTISGMASTVGIVTGMLVTGTGIAANTYVTAVTSNSVTISVAATATGTTVALTFANYYPYTDVQVTGSFAGGSFVVTFGAGTIVNYNPVSSFQPQALMSVALNSLEMVTTVTNINLVTTAIGAPAQGIGVATCTVTGPNFVAAGTLTVIGSPVSGWTGVTNQLDCITGSNVETDTAALIRRATLLAAQANGPIQAIVEKVSEVSGVAASIGFQNLTGAAQQLISFSSVPVSGNYQISINGFTTTALAYNATASTIQTAIQALSGYGQVLVSGTVQYGFAINFNGAYGGQAQPLLSILNNSTGVTITPSFGRPPHSFEIVAEGGTSLAIATAIYGSMPAGISAYSAPTLQTTSSATLGSTTLSVASTAGIVIGNSIYAQGIPPGTTVVSIGVGSVVMSLPALVNTSNVQTIFNNTVTIYDSNNTPNYIGFSRPVQIPIYVSITLVTDIYNTPGVPASGANPNSKFNPQSIATIQSDIVSIGDDVSIGGLVIGFGTNGLIGAFNDVVGIVSYTLFFDTVPSPAVNANIQMQPEQQALFESFNTVVSYT
jgi:hypothetical protein